MDFKRGLGCLLYQKSSASACQFFSKNGVNLDKICFRIQEKRVIFKLLEKAAN